SRGRAEKGWADRVCSGVVIGNYSGPNGELGENETPSSENDAEQAMNSRRRRGQDTRRPHWPWSRSVPIQFASRCCRSHWWSPRRKTETVQNLSNDVRRMDRCHNFHTPQTARAFQNVKLEHASHQFGPRIIPTMPTRSRLLRCAMRGYSRSRGAIRRRG